MKVRYALGRIFEQCGLPKNPDNDLTNLIFVHGIRSYIGDAKKKKLDPRRGGPSLLKRVSGLYRRLAGRITGPESTESDV